LVQSTQSKVFHSQCSRQTIVVQYSRSHSHNTCNATVASVVPGGAHLQVNYSFCNSESKEQLWINS